MSLEKCIELAQENGNVPVDKFDRHMKRARLQDIASRQKAFVLQTEKDVEHREMLSGIVPSVY